MKKLLITLLLAVPVLAMAGGDDSKYLGGAVPEQDGKVVFSKSFKVPGRSEKDIVRTLRSWMGTLVENSIEAPGQYAKMMDGNAARVCEWLVFKKKALNLDRARMRYELRADIQGERITLTVSNIVYYYGEDMQMENGQIFKAEEWISDAEALNKQKTKLYPKSGKFRRKTVDRMEELFNSAMDAFEAKAAAPAQQPKRRGVVED